MSKPESYARISITLPVEVLHQADRLATEADRARSWVIAEAIRQYAGGALPAPASSSAGTTNEANLPSHFASGSPITPDRLIALLADLALSREDRVRASESAVAANGEDSGEQLSLMAFRRPEDYSAWNHRSRSGQ